MDQGWIKLHRKLLDNPIFQNENLLQLFIYCLLKANHEPKKMIFNGKEIVIEKGQFITGRESLSKELKKNPMTTYKRLKILENLEILNIKSNNKFSLVTLVNYGVYQSADEKRNSKRNNEGTTREQRGNTNKNYKNDNNDKEIYIVILDRLNERAGTKFKPNSEETKRLIDARINAGFDVDDFHKVIDIKCAEWLGTEQEKYLRPCTLFGTKFEGYLNQKSGGRTNGQDQPSNPTGHGKFWGKIPGYGAPLSMPDVSGHGDSGDDPF